MSYDMIFILPNHQKEQKKNSSYGYLHFIILCKFHSRCGIQNSLITTISVSKLSNFSPM